jgi:hypothetical protein
MRASKAAIAGSNLVHSTTSLVVSDSPTVVPLRIFGVAESRDESVGNS